MLSKLFKARANKLLEVPIRLLARRGISPNALTIVGFLLNVLVGVVLAMGWTVAGGLLVLFAGIFDMIDGAMARLTGQASRFGALLDSVVDRFSEAAILAGLLWLYLAQQKSLEVLLTVAVLLGSLMVSYVRARAEGLGLDCEVGAVARPERVAILALGLLFSQIAPALVLLAILTHFTVGQRVWHVWRRTGILEQPGQPENEKARETPLKKQDPQKHPPVREMVSEKPT